MEDLEKRLNAAEGLLGFILQEYGPFTLAKEQVEAGLPPGAEINLDFEGEESMVVSLVVRGDKNT